MFEELCNKLAKFTNEEHVSQLIGMAQMKCEVLDKLSDASSKDIVK